jgi:hypothetical protein
VQEYVDLRDREVMPLTEVEQLPLRITAGIGQLRQVVLECHSQLGRAGHTASGEPLQLPHVKQAVVIGAGEDEAE